MGVNVDLKVGNLSLWYWKSFFDRGILPRFCPFLGLKAIISGHTDAAKDTA